MELISKKSILIIAPSLIAESLSLKLTSLDQNLEINFNNGTGDKTPDLVIWNVLNFQSEDLIRLELLKLRERYNESKFLIIISGELVYEANTSPSLNAEGFLLNPSPEKVLESIDTILNGGRVFDIDNGSGYKNPDLVIWNVLNFQSEDLIRLELLKLRERYDESKFLIIISGELVYEANATSSLNAEGFLLNPSAEKVLESIDTILNGGRVFDIENNFQVKFNKNKTLSFSQKILTSGLKQIDSEINYIFKYVNSDSTPEFYKFILKGRLRELITAKSFLIFLWGNSLEIYTEAVYTENKINLENKNTVFIKDKDNKEIWNLILDRLKERYSSTNLQVEFNNSSIILSGIKKEFISRLICKMLDELDNLVKNIKENYK